MKHGSEHWMYGKYGILLWFFCPPLARRTHAKNKRIIEGETAALRAELFVQWLSKRTR